MNFKYSIGNKKLGNDTLIFNMGPASTCPSLAMGLCQVPAGKCYALKAERMYPSVIPYRRAQQKYWIMTSAEKIAEDIRAALARHKKIKYIRVNESGDFRNQKDVDKLVDVAAAVPGPVFYVYTARRDLTIPADRPRNIVFNGSGFMLDNNFSYETPSARFTCAGDCRICNLCMQRGGRIINDPKH